MTLTGGCLCGGVRYEVTEPLTRAGYCHCKRCQRRTGTAASVSAPVRADALQVTGEELVRVWWPPDGWGKAFCSECGSALWSVAPDRSVLGVRLGTFDDDPGVRPQWRAWLSSAAAFEAVPDDGLERFSEGRG
jgi:hypothetical protein